ncbi:unnamed protein product [Caretta caretta]
MIPLSWARGYAELEWCFLSAGDGSSGEDLTMEPSGKQEKCMWCVTEVAADEEEKKHQSIQVLKPPQTKPLYFGSCYTVSSSLDLEVTLEEVDFRYMSPEDQQLFMKIYTKDMREGLKLIVLMKRYGEVVWKVLVRPEDVTLSGSSSEKFKGQFFCERPMGFEADVAIPRPGAQIGGPVSAEGEHFVDRH